MIDCKRDNAKGTVDTASLVPTTKGKGRAVVDPERAARLRQARKLAGFENAVDAARAYGWVESTYGQHENATRGFGNKTLTYASAFHVSQEWLFSGRGLPRAQTRRVPIGGIVGMYGVVNAPDAKKKEELLDEVDAPPGDNRKLIGFRVSGDSNFPAFFNGDVIYTEPPSDPEPHVGKQCIVTLASGERRLGILSRGAAAGLYLLVSFNATPLADIEVTEAAPVVWIRRG